MHNLDQQRDQGIGHFLGSLDDQGCEQRQANSLGMLANMGGRLSSNTSPQALHQLRCIPLKQVRWQANGTQRAQLCDLRERTLHTNWTRVQAQQIQRKFFLFFSLCCGSRHQKGIQAALHLRREAGHDHSVDLCFIGSECCFNERGDVIRNLDLARSTFGTNQLAETFGMVFMCKNVCAKPGEQGFFIGATEFADLRDRADLRSMGLNGPPSQAYWANRAESTPTWVARKRTTSGAASCLERKKRPSYRKHLNKTANPKRVAPDLLPTAFNSSGRRVKCSSNSSDVHVRFIPFPSGVFASRLASSRQTLFSRCSCSLLAPRFRPNGSVAREWSF